MRRFPLAARILLGLIAGLLVGTALRGADAALRDGAVAVAEPIGGVWLDALRMTVIPLVFSLIVTGVASAADAARAGRFTGRVIAIFAALLFFGALVAAGLTPLLLQLWPVPAEAGAALRAGLAPGTAAPEMASAGEFLRSFIPANPVQAAAETAVAPLVVFGLLFGFAATRIEPDLRDRITGAFRAIGQAMLVLVGGVLWLAPFGVFALALVVGARVGIGAAGVLVQYVVIVSAVMTAATLLLYPLAVVFGRVGLLSFLRAGAPAQAVALSTQSSLATLPAMLTAAERSGVSERVRDLVLPLAVSVFRYASVPANLAVVIYLAALYGIELGPVELLVGAAVAAVANLAGVGLPAQVSFFAIIGPVCLALGVPLELLPLLLAVETVPDIFRTVGNVTADLVVAQASTRFEPAPEAGLEAAPVVAGPLPPGSGTV
ncbi:MAG: dicarboxylate/amino acid:cation symporter [Proteobacteria bacterium]|nr:dicarboxylate/amino acid:cation symporter [Pseudomonadota bacterium]